MHKSRDDKNKKSNLELIERIFFLMHYAKGQTENMFSLTETGVVVKIGIKFTSMWNTTEFKLIRIEFIIYQHLYCSSETVGQCLE